MFPKLALQACTKPEHVAEDSDIIVTATPIIENPKPSLFGKDLRPGVCAIALDYDAAFSKCAMRGADRFITDDLQQMLETKQHGPYFKGVPRKERVIDFGHVVAGKKPSRKSAEEKVFLMFMGIAVDDMVTAKLVYDKARSLGSGTKLRLHAKY